AIVKQYKKMFTLNNVELEITDEALRAIAQKSIKLKTGARGLRTIVENAMLEIMYEIPSDNTVFKVIVNKDTIEKNSLPTVLRKEIA
ncbi:ATP-dependent Clp protease ATP-binding subunit ClpX, partial [bacterium]|nr:ATP-dependent Clp protease ATP-binding subunit ClpX [bacterium]